jgi:hypothetical protein
MTTSQLIGLITLVVGVLGVAGMKVWSWYKARPKNFYVPAEDFAAPEPGRGTDAPAPPGVDEYMTLVEKTAPSASHPLWWDYAKRRLSEADILRSEVVRLTPKPAPAKQPAAPAEVKP